MKLWKKNYLLTYILFIVILNLGIFFMVSLSFSNDLETAVDSANNDATDFSTYCYDLYLKDENTIEMAWLADRSKNYGIYLKISTKDKVYANAIPKNLQIPDDNIYILKKSGKQYIGITNIINGFKVTYIKEISSIYSANKIRILSGLGFSILLSFIVGSMLYFAMKKMYKPITNIAHELRTPITGIQGYAQYMLMGKITEADRTFATKEIITETQNLRNIVDKILTMGDLRKSNITKNKLDMEDILLQIKKTYPIIDIVLISPNIWGDKTLISSLLTNLISNAERAGDSVDVAVKENIITIKNNGNPIEPKVLRALNKNIPLDKKQILGNGYGVNLCHEIVKLHDGAIKYESSEKNGTIVTITFKVNTKEKKQH